MIYFPEQYVGLASTFNQALPNNKNRNSLAYRYWFRSLLQRLQSRIGINGWLEEWDELGLKDFFKFVLIYRGFIIGTKTNQLGKIFGWGCLTGWNWAYQPTTASINLPNLHTSTLSRTIGKDCTVLKMTPDYMGLIDVIDYFACKLAGLDAGIDGAIENSKIPQILGANNPAAMKALQQIGNDVASGKAVIVYNTKQLNGNADGTKSSKTKTDFNADNPFCQVKLFTQQDYVLDKLLIDLQTIINQFDAEIGICTVPYQKAERMVTSEADSKQEDSMSRMTVCIDCLNDSVKEWNKYFECDMSFELNTITPQEGDEENVDMETDDTLDRGVSE